MAFMVVSCLAVLSYIGIVFALARDIYIIKYVDNLHGESGDSPLIFFLAILAFLVMLIVAFAIQARKMRQQNDGKSPEFDGEAYANQRLSSAIGAGFLLLLNLLITHDTLYTMFSRFIDLNSYSTPANLANGILMFYRFARTNLRILHIVTLVFDILLYFLALHEYKHRPISAPPTIRIGDDGPTLRKANQCECGELFYGRYCPICARKANDIPSAAPSDPVEEATAQPRIAPPPITPAHRCQCGNRFYENCCPLCGREATD